MEFVDPDIVTPTDRRGAQPARLLNRLLGLRKLQKRWRHWTDAVPPEVKGGAVLGSRLESPPIRNHLRALQAKGFSTGLQLPEHLNAEILYHARNAECVRLPRDRTRFRIGDLVDGRTADGQPVAVARVLSPGCAALDAVAADPLLVQTASRYLGYAPRRVMRRLFWSPISTLPDEVRRELGQTIDYHDDVESGPALAVYFYVTGASRDSGAHVVVAGSHRQKPFAATFAASYQAERRLLDYYGVGGPIVIEGRPGSGFFEDPACFHKALPPRTAPRLVLQLRYC